MKAYSYLRFSTVEQIKGDSLRRQLEAAETYAEAHSLELDHSSYRDLGVSAYRGKNAVEGKLGQFIEAVDSGAIPKGSILIIESLDRLSRDAIMPALNRFSSLLEKGIDIVTLSDNKRFTRDSLNNLPDLMLSLLVMSRAHEESAIKSKRIRAAWDNKRQRAVEAGTRLSVKCPAWLKPTDNGFVLIPERAAIVAQIFDMALQGHGTRAIARALNEQKVPTFLRSNGWYRAGIKRLLSNPAVIGVFQPQSRADHRWKRLNEGPPIEGYYPAVISEDIYYRVQAMRPRVSGKGGRPLQNALSGVAICGLCYGPISMVSKRNGKSPKKYNYLVCSHGQRRLNNCIAKPIPYDFAYTAISHVIGDSLKAQDLLLVQEDSQSKAKAKKEAIEGQIAETEIAIANLLDSLERIPSKALERRLAELETKLSIQLQVKEAAKAAIFEAANANQPLDDALSALAQAAIDRNDETELGEIRVRLNAALKRLLDHIEIDTSDYTKESPIIGLRLVYSDDRGMVARVVALERESP